MIPASSKPPLSIPSGKAAEIRFAAPNVTVQLLLASRMVQLLSVLGEGSQ
jgi:hypothetical protein